MGCFVAVRQWEKGLLAGSRGAHGAPLSNNTRASGGLLVQPFIFRNCAQDIAYFFLLELIGKVITRPDLDASNIDRGNDTIRAIDQLLVIEERAMDAHGSRRRSRAV